LYGLWALKSAGVSQSDGAFARALTFICRCQNYSATPNGKYDDGGFFFSPAEPLRNKAGVAGIDSAGRTRFRSYGSATVDGLQILILCGLPGDDPRVRAAVGCLKKWNEVEHNPGEFDPSDEDIRDATYFYYCRGLAQCARYLDDPHVVRRLAETLLLKQRSDGTWANPFNDAKEDDPLVATPLAMEALEDCRGILEGRP
jgi:squalene-hopene/tetraprenyl-beta-curcumene cyclase